MRNSLFIVSVLIIFSVLWLFGNQFGSKQSSISTIEQGITQPAPDFSLAPTVIEKKQQFFAYLQPGIRYENARVEQEREQVLEWQTKWQAKKALSAQDTQAAEMLSSRYLVDWQQGIDQTWFDEMLNKVNVIADGLIFAQAANESAWGTSRFAREANNYFGQWCYSQGCGVVPATRNEGMTHEVAKFASVQESLHRYFMNINTNAAYQELRQIRAELVGKQDLYSVETALELTKGLSRYSERGEDYIFDLQAMIKQNQQYWVNN